MESIYDAFMDGKRRKAQAVAFALALGGFCNQTRIMAVEDGPATVDTSECLPEQEPVEHVRHQGAKQRARQLKRQAAKQQPVDETLTNRSQICEVCHQETDLCAGLDCVGCLYPAAAGKGGQA